jgi:hypothetical protein
LIENHNTLVVMSIEKLEVFPKNFTADEVAHNAQPYTDRSFARITILRLIDQDLTDQRLVRIR